MVWEVKKGRITAVKVDGAVFYCNGNKEPHVSGGRIPVINKWIKEKIKVGKSFNLDEFYRDHPTCKQKTAGTDNEISRLCRTGVLSQTSNTSFKVLKCI